MAYGTDDKDYGMEIVILKMAGRLAQNVGG